METIRKEELVDRILEQTRLPKTTIWRVLDATLEEIAKALANHERVHLSRFGTFDLRHYPARMGVHPRTGEEIPYPERYAPSFRSSLTLKRRIRAEEE
ncbi:MAG: HU family DNA-binding protein [Chloroflexia bacterium]|nr:HU family DNA-binding protein [Chloroflexia bacterium]